MVKDLNEVNNTDKFFKFFNKKAIIKYLLKVFYN